MKTIFRTIWMCSAVLLCSCEVYRSPDRNYDEEPAKSLYVEAYDPIADVGQYWHPELAVKPTRYVSCAFVCNQPGNNDLGITDPNLGLQGHLLAQSMAGLVNRAVQEGKTDIGVWLRDEANSNSYKAAKQGLSDMGISEWSVCVPSQVGKDYGELRPLVSGYVLTDVENNPESNIVASVAAHVYNAIIVDKRDEATYRDIYPMLYDATQKTTADAWREFKDKCSNKALVIMPVQTGQLREFVISHRLFILNINKAYADPSKGQNTDILDEVLAWLEPGAPVYGWEQGVNEDSFVGRVSRSGHAMVPYDWAYNTGMTSLAYKSRQKSTLARVTNPSFIDWDDPAEKFVSFYLSDGDNVQWMMNDFEGSDYYTHPEAANVKMSFGLAAANLSMMCPDQFDRLLSLQNAECSLLENLGGGYYYVDTFGESSGDRTGALNRQAERVAAHMRQHRIKVLGLVAMDARSERAKEAYRTFIEANDQLAGVVVIQYSPYAGGEGAIMWFTNSAGYDIPVVTVRYSIWNFGSNNQAREGTPAYIAHKIINESSDNPFTAVSVHAWSKFVDTGTSDDEVAEAAEGGTVVGPGAAALCARRLPENVRVVNLEELIWRVRMHYRPEQTLDYLSKTF